MSRAAALVVVGPGRLGGALALALRRAGHRVSVVAHSAAAEARRRALRLRAADDAALRAAGVVFLCVPDRVVPEAAAAVAPRVGRRTAVVHCAGALTLGALAAVPGPRGSFHPLCAVSAPTDGLAGASVAVSGDSPALVRRLAGLAKDIGCPALRVPEAGRAAYHAGAVLSAGAVVALLSAGVEALGAAGVSEEEALPALLALARSALRGVEARGLSGGLTGPVVRGDVQVVAAHVAALPPGALEVYRVLGTRMVGLAGSRLGPAEAQRVLAALQASGGPSP